MASPSLPAACRRAVLRLSATQRRHLSSTAPTLRYNMPAGMKKKKATAEGTADSDSQQSASGKPLTEAETAALRRGIEATVGRTATWLPDFALRFVHDCLLDAAVQDAHAQRRVGGAPDPLFALPVRILPEDEWRPATATGADPRTFSPFRDAAGTRDTQTMFRAAREQLDVSAHRMLALHKSEPGRRYVVVGSVGSLPACEQPPVAWDGPHGADLIVDPEDRTPRVFVRLDPAMPPLLWLPVQPQVHLVQRLLREVRHRMLRFAQEGRAFWVERMDEGEHLLTTQDAFLDPATGQARLDDPSAWNAAMNLAAVCRRPPNGHILPGAPEKQCTVYLGPWALGDHTWEDMWALNPYLHSWPAFRSFSGGQMTRNTFDGRFEDGSEASPADYSVWVTRFSKSVIVLHHRLDVGFSRQVEWAEGCAHGSAQLDDGVKQQQKALMFPRVDPNRPHPDMGRHHQFATVFYPQNKLMCGGGAAVARFNAALGAELPADAPVDVAAALQHWRCHGSDALHSELLSRAAECTHLPLQSYQELLAQPDSPWLRYADTIVKLGVVGHEELPSILEALEGHPSCAVRWAVAKVAQVSRRMVCCCRYCHIFKKLIIPLPVSLRLCNYDFFLSLPRFAGNIDEAVGA